MGAPAACPRVDNRCFVVSYRRVGQRQLSWAGLGSTRLPIRRRGMIPALSTNQTPKHGYSDGCGPCGADVARSARSLASVFCCGRRRRAFELTSGSGESRDHRASGPPRRARSPRRSARLGSTSLELVACDSDAAGGGQDGMTPRTRLTQGWAPTRGMPSGKQAPVAARCGYRTGSWDCVARGSLRCSWRLRRGSDSRSQ